MIFSGVGEEDQDQSGTVHAVPVKKVHAGQLFFSFFFDAEGFIANLNLLSYIGSTFIVSFF